MTELCLVSQPGHSWPQLWATSAQTAELFRGTPLEVGKQRIGDRCDRYSTICHASITPFILLTVRRKCRTSRKVTDSGEKNGKLFLRASARKRERQTMLQWHEAKYLPGFQPAFCLVLNAEIQTSLPCGYTMIKPPGHAALRRIRLHAACFQWFHSIFLRRSSRQ